MSSIAHALMGVNWYTSNMEITQLERAQIIIDTLKARVHGLEEALLAEQTAHALTRLSYQKVEEASIAEGKRFVENG